jgi:hypothetical protein
MASRFDMPTLSRVPRFLFAARRIRRQVLRSPGVLGVLGVSLIAMPMRKTFYTLSGWQNRKPAHNLRGRCVHEVASRRFAVRRYDNPKESA